MSESRNESAPRGGPATVLVVDDEPTNVRLMEAYLAADGLACRRAFDGFEALQQIASGGIDLVILDVRMPRMDGFEVCRRIRQDPLNARLPVIFLTAELRDPDSEMAGFDAGADEYLHKPVQRRPLLARVKSLLRLADAERDRRLAAQLAQTEKFAAIGQIAAGVAHEINNPLAFILANLNSLRGYLADFEEVLEAYRRSQDDGRQAEARLGLQATLSDVHALIRETADGGNRVRGIVQQLKTFSRAEDDLLESVDLAEVAAATLTLTERELALKARIARDLQPARLERGPRARLHQLVLNLLINAHQALTGPAERNEIRVSTRTEGDRVVLAVSDTGCGIPPALQTRIFEPFFTTKPVGVGSGLGLSVCANVVRKLGGTIGLQSDGATGTTFTVALPAQPVATTSALLH